jgi:ATP-binding cassette subfamily C (CFTR/MRP) protein 4
MHSYTHSHTQANIDGETDSVIQAVIRDNERGFGRCTLLTVAHRLDTLVDSDRIAVMDQGRVVEIGTPRALAAQRGTIFAELLSKASKEVQSRMRKSSTSSSDSSDSNGSSSSSSSNDSSSSSSSDVRITVQGVAL